MRLAHARWRACSYGPVLRLVNLSSAACLTRCCTQTVKMGVQYSLWGGSILNLGTEKHRKAYFEDIDKFRLPGQPGCIFCAAKTSGHRTVPPCYPSCLED